MIDINAANFDLFFPVILVSDPIATAKSGTNANLAV